MGVNRGVGGRAGSAYNLRLPPKASGKDTGCGPLAGARIFWMCLGIASLRRLSIVLTLLRLWGWSGTVSGTVLEALTSWKWNLVLAVFCLCVFFVLVICWYSTRASERVKVGVVNHVNLGKQFGAWQYVVLMLLPFGCSCTVVLVLVVFLDTCCHSCCYSSVCSYLLLLFLSIYDPLSSFLLLLWIDYFCCLFRCCFGGCARDSRFGGWLQRCFFLFHRFSTTSALPVVAAKSWARLVGGCHQGLAQAFMAKSTCPKTGRKISRRRGNRVRQAPTKSRREAPWNPPVEVAPRAPTASTIGNMENAISVSKQKESWWKVLGYSQTLGVQLGARMVASVCSSSQSAQSVAGRNSDFSLEKAWLQFEDSSSVKLVVID